MKIKLILFSAILGFIASSCRDLYLEPKGQLGETELFGNENGVKKYFAGLYQDLPIEGFNYSAYGFYRGWDSQKYSLGNMSGEFVNQWCSVNNNGFGYWPYSRIRDVNLFIKDFPNFKSKYDVATYNSLLGEAYFLRAFYYFGLAKRYGGVPIIKEVQNPLGDLDSLTVPRAQEYNTWKFIHDDLQFAIDNLRSTSENGRANKYVAAALMSRAMLYAGSIAKYTTYLNFQADQSATQQGFAWIDPSKANEFFQYSYDAGKIVEQGPYSLYNSNPDQVLNFANLFLDPASPENIFIKNYDKTSPRNTGLLHSYDGMMSPAPDFSSAYGTSSYPALDFMMMYDFTSIVDTDGKPVRFNAREDIKNGMEPRLRGTVYFHGDVLRGVTFSIQRGIYLSFPGLASDAQLGSSDAPINSSENRILGNKNQLFNGVPITGRHGQFENVAGENNCWTGAFIRKYINTDMAVSDASLYNSGTPWIVFRLGEIYLNMAEASYELGNKTEAFDYIQTIRTRAGCQVTRPPDNPTDLSAIYGYPIDGNLQFIRDERYRELFGENHRWWDLRRWRIVDRVLNEYIPRALECYYIPSEDKWIYLEEIVKNNPTWTASKAAHYEPIPQEEINKNSNLLPQNPLH